MDPHDGGIHIWIHQIYVEKEFRKIGILSKIFKYVQDKAKIMEGVKKIIMGVADDNELAKSIYSKFGMKQSQEKLYWANVDNW